MSKNTLVILSGGFDPVHLGHVAMMREAAVFGDIIICLNSDEWLTRKKGKPFMTWEDRAAVMGNMKNVIDVVRFDDDNGTAINGIIDAYEKYKSFYDIISFGNGGDRKNNTTPTDEQLICDKLGISLLWNLGGDKIQSSSRILDEWHN